jgi:transcriptional regulator with XRE-family HTH domain
MNIRIGESIKKLRKQNDITQEKLAEYLGISYQAISKWENGTAFPDITLIPILANFFGISIDQLFAIDAQVRDEKAKEYETDFSRLNSIGDAKGRISLMRKALKDYPRNFKFMFNLAYALSNFSATKEQEKESLEHGYIEEALVLCERILEDCVEDDIRHGAIQILCSIYPKYEHRDKAIELAYKMPSLLLSKEKLLENILTGEEKIKQIQQNILLQIDSIANSLIRLSFDRQMGEGLSYEQKIDFVKASNKLYETICSDGNYLFFNCRLAWNYRRLAELFCSTGESDKSIECLEAAAKYAEKYDNLSETEKYTSLFINRCEYKKGEIIKDWMGSESGMLYFRMNESVFDKVREMVRFKTLLTKLDKNS